MRISPEGKLGLLLALIGLAGAGAIMIAPEHTVIGWLLIVIAVVGGIALTWHHYRTLPVASGPVQRRPKLVMVGLFLCFAGAILAVTGLVITFIGTRQNTVQDHAAITPSPEKPDRVFVPPEVTPVPIPSSASNPVLIEPPQSARKNPDGSQRIFIRVLPHEMTAIFEGRTTNQAMALVAPYLLKWIAFSAIVNNVKTYADGTTIVHLVSVTNHLTVTVTTAEFEQKWRDNLSVVNKGDTLNVVCRISSIDQSIINMDRCEIISK